LPGIIGACAGDGGLRIVIKRNGGVSMHEAPTAGLAALVPSAAKWGGDGMGIVRRGGGGARGTRGRDVFLVQWRRVQRGVARAFGQWQ